jgi:predicted ribosome quality control (RQC) complex YloA/Tae2 family protein
MRRDHERPVKTTDYQLADGWRVRAGSTDWDNDQLSLRIARPRDWWFHVKGMPGSHVVLSHSENIEPDRSVLEQAAAIAAWHSKARNGGIVAVTCTQAMNVSKPKGYPPGKVQVRKDRTLKVRPAVPK